MESNHSRNYSLSFQGVAPVIRSDGTLIRDYIYVEDAVNAYLTLAEELFKNSKLSGEAFNFSNETQKNVLELANLIIKIMDSSLKLDVQGENNGEIKYQYLDSNKAKEILSWKPKFGLEKGLTKTISWYKSFFNNA